MPDRCVSDQSPASTASVREADDSNRLTKWVESPEQRIVRVEANFLRLPLFALDNKHLRTMQGIRCEGTFRRAGQTYAFTFSATRNIATLYPGPLARSAHFGILSFATDGGFPVRNPVVFSWRQLCARMGIQCSGKTTRQLRDALVATKGLLIESRHALFSKSDDRMIDTVEERENVIGLYDELEFFGTRRPDGTTVTTNAVWLSRWYVDNLNALYSGPLDHHLWRRLNSASPMASRLYEFLQFKFCSGQDTLRFNYPTLVKFIPARLERYYSDARKQLDSPLTLLVDAGVLAAVYWTKSRDGHPQIEFVRGRLLAPTSDAPVVTDDVAEDDFTLQAISATPTPTEEIVQTYHRSFGHADFRPTKAELKLAEELIVKYELDPLRKALPTVAKRLRKSWPDAKSFVAAARYVDEVMAEMDRRQSRRAAEEVAQKGAMTESERESARSRERAALLTQWQSLSADEQDLLRKAVLARQPPSLNKYPGLLDRLCLEEMARRESLGS